MKSIEEIQTMLVNELWNRLDRVKSLKSEVDYYNDILGDTSFLLSGLLGALLELRSDWDKHRWIDDSLLLGVKLTKNKLSIWGVMIWGIENTTEQWTEPFYFEVVLDSNESDFSEYTFLLGDLNKPEIPYEEYRVNRNYWEEDERNWKYIINKKN